MLSGEHPRIHGVRLSVAYSTFFACACNNGPRKRGRPKGGSRGSKAGCDSLGAYLHSSNTFYRAAYIEL